VVSGQKIGTGLIGFSMEGEPEVIEPGVLGIILLTAALPKSGASFLQLVNDKILKAVTIMVIGR